MECPIINKSFQGLLLISILILSISLNSCYYDNEEELYPEGYACDTTNITYATVVAPILTDYCIGCHSGNAPSAGITLDNYTDLQTVINSGQFRGSINHESNFSAMPKNSPKLSDCNLAKINKWLDSGAPNN